MNLFTKLINFFSRSDGKKSGSRSSSPVVIIRREKDYGNSPNGNDNREDKRSSLTPKLVLIPLLCVLFMTSGYSQAANSDGSSTCATWSLMNNGTATSVSPNLVAPPQNLSGGSSAPLMTVFTPYVSTGQRLWVGNTGWVAGARDPNRYIEFNLSATTGNQLTVNTVSFNYGDNTGTTNFNILQSQVFFSIDNWSTSTQLGGTLNYQNTTMQSFNANIVGGVTVPMGYQFSVRIYPYSPVGSNPMNPSFAIHHNVQICEE
ncbi:MAG: hypothetical protein KA747_04630, partial [Ignavibacteriaceae bacterium]|nr:hypothetical protein [Ignavibacteriaceae bacterium]